jgi:hypothetical protein
MMKVKNIPPFSVEFAVPSAEQVIPFSIRKSFYARKISISQQVIHQLFTTGLKPLAHAMRKEIINQPNL